MSVPEGRRTTRPPRPPGPGGTPDRQTIAIRRTLAAIGAVVLIILLVVGINGCLDSRKDRAYRDYADDVRALTRSQQQVSEQLFKVLSTPSKGDALDTQTQLNALRVDAQQLADRAADTDHPDELAAANDWLTESFQFRADAIASIAEQLPAALGDKGSKRATELIAGQMQALLASDVLYLQRALPDANGAYDERGIQESFPTERFLPELSWLDTDTVTRRLSRVGGTGEEAAATPGLHGTGLQSVTIQPGGTQLTDGGVNRIALADQLSFDVEVQNQGESEETDVTVTVTIDTGKRISLDQDIPRIAAGETETVSVPLTETPTTGKVGEMTVAIAPVPGEGTKDNNNATYQVVFSE